MPGACCCCWLTATCTQNPVWAHENKRIQRELAIQSTKDICQWQDQPGTVCISTLGPFPSAHKQQPPFTTAVFLSFHPPLIHATGALKTPAPSCVYPAQVPTQCSLRVPLSAERPPGSPSWGSPPGGLSSSGMPTATAPRGTRCSLRLAAFSQNCLGSP